MIPVYKASDNNLYVNAREVYWFLGVTTQNFSTWFKRGIEKFPFEEKEDYWNAEDFPYTLLDNAVFSPKLLEDQSGISTDLVAPNCPTKSLPQTRQHGVEQKDYILTLDTAKELAMLDKGEKGKAVRRYFIACEKELYATRNNNDLTLIPNRIQELEQQNKVLSETLAEAVFELRFLRENMLKIEYKLKISDSPQPGYDTISGAFEELVGEKPEQQLAMLLGNKASKLAKKRHLETSYVKDVHNNLIKTYPKELLIEVLNAIL